MHNYHERDSNLSMHNINYNRFRITCFSQHEVSKSQRGNCIPMKNVVTVSFFHANYISKQIHICISIPIILSYTGIKQNIFVANNNQLE